MLFVHESRLAASPARVFAFHAQPDALARLIPPWQRVEIVEPPTSLRAGTRVVLRMRLGPVWTTWVAEHTAFEENVLFRDEMISGPFRRWVHTHRFLPDGEGTRLRDEVDFAAPLGLSALALPSLRRTFAYRHEATRRAVGS